MADRWQAALDRMRERPVKRFSTEARRVVVIAGDLSAERGYIDVSDLRDAVGLLDQPDSPGPHPHVPFTREAKRCLERSLAVAEADGATEIEPRHILAAADG